MYKIFQFLIVYGLTIVILHSCISNAAEAPAKEKANEVDILHTMSLYQRFSQKVWYAGKENNWELADFYVHELHEITEELVDGGVTHDDYDISQLAKTMLEPAVENLDKSVKQKNQEDFITNYTALTNSCNACHTVTKHPFIKIIIPKYPIPFNQDFKLK